MPADGQIARDLVNSRRGFTDTAVGDNRHRCFSGLVIENAEDMVSVDERRGCNSKGGRRECQESRDPDHGEVCGRSFTEHLDSWRY
jgi:hypothetical protein